MKKKAVLNICMVVTMILVAVCGVIAVGSVKGWFEGEEASLTVCEKFGIVMLERSGVAYEISEGMTVREGDILHTQQVSGLQLRDAKRVRISLDENAEISITEMKEKLEFEVLQGDALVDARGIANVTVLPDGTQVALEDAVVSVSVQAGASMVHVYAGKVSLISAGEKVWIEAGQVATVVGNVDTPEIKKFTQNSLSDGQMIRLIECGMDDSFCFSQESLEKVRAEREKTALETEQDDAALHCSIEIRCDTILDNMEELAPGKEGYVPSNGVILAATEVAFEEGETVFDVLQRVCNSSGIQIEYSYTPLYENYYIEGINHLYEFDCGSESGWMYKVNEWFPNYGCSGYYLQNGDIIVWCFTCNGLGTDVGGGM